MNQIIKILLCISISTQYFTYAFAQHIDTNNLKVTNLTSGQITVTLATAQKTVSLDIPANMNPILNDIAEPEPNPFVIYYDASPIQKIMIKRLTTTMPQIIYYDNEQRGNPDLESLDQNPGGLYNVSVTGHGNIEVRLDQVIINKFPYRIYDLSSYVVRCNVLKKSITPRNLDVIQKQIDDLMTSLKLVQNSDMASDVESQIFMVEAAIDTVVNDVKIMHSLNKNLKMVESLHENLTHGTRMLLDGENNYSDNSVKEAEQALQNLHSSLRILTETSLHGAVRNQAIALQNTMNKLHNAIQQVKTTQMGVDHEMLIPPYVINL